MSAAANCVSIKNRNIVRMSLGASARPSLKVSSGRTFMPLLLLFLALHAMVHAQFNYATNNGTVSITRYIGPGVAVAIPDTINGLLVTSIDVGAFFGSEVTSVTIPKSVASIGFEAFSDCSSLVDITVDSLNPSYSSVDGVLFDKSQTTLVQCPGGKTGSYTVPSSVTSVGSFAFSGCTCLTNATLPNSVTDIGNSAFNRCSSLISVTIPISVTSLGDSVFIGCSSLTGVTVPNSVTSIKASTFFGCTSLANFVIPESVTSIGRSAFYGCASLTNITIIAEEAFSGCTSLANFVIPESVTNIGTSAFVGCNSLSNITIPDSVISIGASAFSGCTSLSSVMIPSSVTSIGDSSFSGCTSLNAITADALNPSYSSLDGVLFNKSQTALIQFPGGKAGSYTVPNSVVS